MHSINQLDDELVLDLESTVDPDLRIRRSTAIARPARRAPIDRSQAAAQRLRLRARRRAIPLIVAWRTVKAIGPVAAGDLFALALAGLLAQALVRAVGPSQAIASGWLSLAALLPLVAAYWLGGLYSSVGIHAAVELRQISQLTTIGLLAAAIGGAFASPSPMWCAAAWCFSLGLVPIVRALVRHWCSSTSWWPQPALLISSGAAAEEVSGILLHARTSGLKPVAIADPSDVAVRSHLPVISDGREIQSLVSEHAIRYAVIALPESSHTQLSRMVEHYSSFIPHLLVLTDAAILPNLGVPSRACGRLSGMEMRNARMLPTRRLAKRLLDLAIGGGAMLLCLPLFVLVALLIKLTSRGPIFFGHRRIGRDGVPFQAWKFRTMHTDGDRILRERLERDPAAREAWERDHKLRDDPRVTRIGRILRKSSLDELPQVWNVLRGNMSLVGPRPIVTSEIWRYGNRFKLYTAVKPGITGLWQVSGRSETSYEERVRFDEYYVRNWSPWLDVYIIARTAPSLLKSTGAY